MKKSMAILLILAFASCQKNDIEKVSPKPFDIKNVKEWYLSKTSKAKLNGEDSKLKKEIVWEKARNGKHFDGSEVWVMPISYADETVRLNLLAKNKEEPNKVKFKSKDELKSDNALEFLTIKKNNFGVYEIENVITAEYTDKKKKDEFEGLLYIYDSNNKLKTGFLIEDNKVKYLLSESKNAKVSGLVCAYLVTTTSYTYTVTIGNNTAGPYSNFYTTVTALSCYYDNNSVPYVSYSGLVTNTTSGGSGSSNSGFGYTYVSPGLRPLATFTNKCSGINDLWQRSVNTGNEVNGVLATDGTFFVTEVSGPTGGSFNGLYKNNGLLYYFFPVDGGPAPTNQGTITVNGRYFIPIIATVHSHTPCLYDGSNGVGGQSPNDATFANGFVDVAANHYVIGCGAIGQFSSNSNGSYFNIQTGSLSSTCNYIK